MSAPMLELEGISKRYGGVHALDDVGFDLQSGEVHALMGENGAGKSTLMKILAGNVERDEGLIRIDGKDVEVGTPSAARAHGIAIIHQELNTLPFMTVAENLALGEEPKTRFGMLDRRRMRETAREKLDLIGARIDPDQPLGSLSVGMQQMVEIARAVGEDARVLVLDEPTAALSRRESEQLYGLIGQMRERGVGLIYISHRMEEVWRLADRITVLRDGRYIGTGTASELSESEVVSMMVGRNIADLYSHESRDAGAALLEVRGLEGNGIGPVNLTVRSGEVVCMAGLIGAGRTELARLIFGADHRAGGEVLVDGKPSAPQDPAAAIADGIGMVPEDRKDMGLFLEHNVKDNIAISSLNRLSRGGILRRGQIREAVREKMRRLHLRENAIDLPVEALSGGNQQKAAVARWLLRDSRVLILDEPTRGVDIGAKREIYDLIDELARAGKAILVISSDLPEAIGIGDRLLVMRDGRIVQEMPSADATEEIVMTHATGARIEKDASAPKGATT